MNPFLFSLIALFISQVSLAGGACDNLPPDPSLYWTLGISPSSLTERSDDSVIADIGNTPEKGVLRRIAIVRTMIWSNTLAYRLDHDGHITVGGKWRTGRINHPTMNYKYQVVHWQDLDDNSFTAYFKGSKLCELYYEN